MRPGTKGSTAAFWVVVGGLLIAAYVADLPTWALFVGFFVFAIPWGIYSVLWGRRHRKVLAAWAAQHGWTTLPNGDPTLIGISTLPPFGQGTTHEESDVLQAPGGGWPLFSYTYRWSTPEQRRSDHGSNADLNGQYAHVVAAMLPAQYPYLEVAPGAARGGAGGRAGAGDAQPYVTGNPDFDQRFHVITSDPAFAAHILASGVADAMLAEPPACRSWRVEGAAVLWWRPGYTTVEAIEPAARLVSAVATAAAGVPRATW